MRNQNRTRQSEMAKKLVRPIIAITCIASACVGYGFLNGATDANLIGPASTKKTAKMTSEEKAAREMLLTDAKKSAKPKEGAKESSVIFNDPFVQTKWGLERTSARQAWEITKGSKDIVVAVIDTGIDEKHSDLSENLWVNPGESGVVQSDFCNKQSKPLSLKECDKARDGIDNDKNGYVDDVHGWDFVHNGKDLIDNHGHGTHIAGIIGARGENGAVSGVSPHVSLMVLKYYDPKSANSNNLKNTIQAIRYAIQMKAQIINYSGGGTDYSAEEFAAVKDAEKAGILFVAAAGNEKSNSDESGKHYYPADYGLSNIISVTAVNKAETKVLASSNYGVRTVDLAAPGENIYSTLPGGSFGMMTGTSQATAFVSGVAALIMAHNREFEAPDVKKYILRTGDEYPTLLSKTGTAKLLNSYKALVSLDKGVGLTGVIASNTALTGKKAFSSDQNIKDPKFNTSALNATSDDNEEPAEAIAMFGKEFMKAVSNGKVESPIGEIRH